MVQDSMEMGLEETHRQSVEYRSVNENHFPKKKAHKLSAATASQLPDQHLGPSELNPVDPDIKRWKRLQVVTAVFIVVLFTIVMFSWSIIQNHTKISILEVKFDALAKEIGRGEEYQYKFIGEVKDLVIEQSKYQKEQLDVLEKKLNMTSIQVNEQATNHGDQLDVLEKKLNMTSIQVNEQATNHGDQLDVLEKKMKMQLKKLLEQNNNHRNQLDILEKKMENTFKLNKENGGRSVQTVIKPSQQQMRQRDNVFSRNNGHTFNSVGTLLLPVLMIFTLINYAST